MRSQNLITYHYCNHSIRFVLTLVIVFATSIPNISTDQKILPTWFYDFPIEKCMHDPWIFSPGIINITRSHFLEISNGSSHTGAVFIGLQGLSIGFDQHNLMTLEFTIEIPEVYFLSSSYNATGELDLRPFRQVTFPSGQFLGNGPLVAFTKNVYIEGTIRMTEILMTGYIRVHQIKVDNLNFTSAFVNLGSFKVDNGSGFEEVDWVTWNRDFMSNFNFDWADISIKDSILAKIAMTMNQNGLEMRFVDYMNFLKNPCEEIPKATSII